MGFKQVPTIQNPNVLVQSWTIEPAKGFLAPCEMAKRAIYLILQ